MPSKSSTSNLLTHIAIGCDKSPSVVLKKQKTLALQHKKEADGVGSLIHYTINIDRYRK